MTNDEHLKGRLSSIYDKQDKNKQALMEHDRIEEQLAAFHQREMRLFDSLHHVWGKDKELGGTLEHDRLALQDEQRKITQKLHDNKQNLQQGKLSLLNEEEEERATLRRLQIREE